VALKRLGATLGPGGQGCAWVVRGTGPHWAGTQPSQRRTLAACAASVMPIAEWR
jgi:hypothetical protein